jgi:pimeloyl-ACP methyl ester carboxylesterase
VKLAPIFVPFGEEYFPAVVTLPDGAPRALAVLLQGIGADEPIGSTFAGRVAARLADAGIASVRFDYIGIGDATGIVPSWGKGQTELLADQTRAAVATVREALPVEHFIPIGVCVGCAVAGELLHEHDCAGIALLAAPIGEFRGWAKTRAGAQNRRYLRPLLRLIKGSPFLRRVIIGVSKKIFAERKPSPLLARALTALDRTRILCIYGSAVDIADNYSEGAVRRVLRAVESMPADQRARWDFRRLDTGPLTMFGILPDEQQEATLDVLERFVDLCLEERGAAARIPSATPSLIT